MAPFDKGYALLAVQVIATRLLTYIGFRGPKTRYSFIPLGVRTTCFHRDSLVKRIILYNNYFTGKSQLYVTGV